MGDRRLQHTKPVRYNPGLQFLAPAGPRAPRQLVYVIDHQPDSVAQSIMSG